ncbi:hypothetical protein B0H13DRAFT_1875030 [Mycena leptocephala]|nr:hypothetical protein B0H13DRAFT_1875030 [Mycena leptocephala]
MDSFLEVPDILINPPLIEEAVSIRVEHVCNTLKTIEISDETYALKEHWIPPRPINDIIARVLRPSVFMLQSALDPHYCNFSDGGYHLSAASYQKLAYTLQKQLELISDWFSLSSYKIFTLLRSPIMDPGVILLAYLLPAAQLRPLLLPLVFSEVEKGLGKQWSPGVPFSTFLEKRTRPTVFFIQNTVDPSFSLSPPFNISSLEDRGFVQEALAEVLLQLDFLVGWVFRETKTLGTSSSSIKTPDLLFPSEVLNMARILTLLVDEFGYGKFSPPLMESS